MPPLPDAPLVPEEPLVPGSDGVEVPGVQRSSESCAQTCCSVCDASNPAAWVHVVYAPIEQIMSPHAQTSSVAPALIRNPQCGIASVSTTTVGQRLVA